MDFIPGLELAKKARTLGKFKVFGLPKKILGSEQILPTGCLGFLSERVFCMGLSWEVCDNWETADYVVGA